MESQIAEGRGLFIAGEHKVARLDQLRIWAERGLIHYEDGKDNSFGTISIRSALHRVQALNDMLGNRSEDADIPRFREYREKMQAFIEAMREVIQRAREQGSPNDPTARPARTTQVVIPAAYFGGL